MKKKVLMVIPHMVGGGAERVAAQIINKLNERGYDTGFILTNANKNEVVRSDLNENTQLILLTEEMKTETAVKKVLYLPFQAYSTILGKMYEKHNKYVPASVGKAAIECQYHREITWLRKYLQCNPDMTVIAFLQPAIPIVLLAARNLSNKVIISERGDPRRLMKKRYGKPFIEKYYTRADSVVFQTEEAKLVYPEVIAQKGTVIPNPIKENLPKPYHGERKKNITTFCRISNQKNLPLLINAFYNVHKSHPEYILRIIGDAPNEEGRNVLSKLYEQTYELKIKEFVKFEPFTKNIHEAVIRDAIYVNSSDYEGISNAMLEAMAIGMPVVCTDCPIGGAKTTINNLTNGILVPTNDIKALQTAILELIEKPELAFSLSLEASKIRAVYSLNSIIGEWMKII